MPRLFHRVAPMLRRACVVLMVLIAATMTPAVSRGAAPPSDAEQYIALIDAYRDGRTRDAVIDLSNREDKWIEAAHAAAVKTAATWPTGRAEAGVLLHTETVAGGWVLPNHNELHLSAARRLMAFTQRPLSTSLRRQWLLVLSTHFQAELDLGSLVPVLDELRGAYRDDPEVDLASGRFYEALGWTSTTPGTLTWNTRSRLLSSLPHQSQQDALQEAAAAFERATRHPSTHVEATTRLGRMLAALNRPQDARAQLAPIVAGASETRWRYLAALFIAYAETRAGNADVAANAYESANTLLPGCQTPLVGLTMLSRLRGMTTQAAEIASRLTSARGRVCDDPWWYYRFGPSPDRVPEQLEQMRREFLR